jgi:ketosteroid isomerase-like protein
MGSSDATNRRAGGSPDDVAANLSDRVERFLVGDSVPPDLFAAGAVVAIPDDSDIETAARLVIDPAENATAVRRPAGRIVLAARQGTTLLVEGVRVRQDEPVATFVASVRLAPDGRVARYLEFGCRGACDPLPGDAGVLLADTAVADTVDRYFHALDVGDFADAAACFSDDVLYSHPPYRHTGIDGYQRVEFRGRSELLAAFERRGRTAFDHHVSVYAQHGAHGLIEGRVDGLPNGGSGSFVSSLSLDDTGRIRRYVSFYCEPGVEP